MVTLTSAGTWDDLTCHSACRTVCRFLRAVLCRAYAASSLPVVRRTHVLASSGRSQLSRESLSIPALCCGGWWAAADAVCRCVVGGWRREPAAAPPGLSVGWRRPPPQPTPSLRRSAESSARHQRRVTGGGGGGPAVGRTPARDGGGPDRPAAEQEGCGAGTRRPRNVVQTGRAAWPATCRLPVT